MEGAGVFVKLAIIFVLLFSFQSFAKAQELKVALLGDTGAGSKFARVLELIASEKADVVMINGDFGYSDSPREWRDQLVKNIDINKFKVIGSMGNHDVGPMSTGQYIYILNSFRNDQNGLKESCTGKFSPIPWVTDITIVDEVCTFGNVSIVASAIGQMFTKSYFEKRLESKLKKIPSQNWKLVGYHYTLASMTPGLKPDENSHKFFDIILQYGAIGAQAHTHSVMASCPINSKFEIGKPVTCDSDFGSDLENRFVKDGVGLYIDSSLGGKDLRNRGRCLKPDESGCAHMIDLITKEGYTRVDGKSDKNFYTSAGAMFFVFNVGGNENRAFAYYKSIDGKEVFRFNLTK